MDAEDYRRWAFKCLLIAQRVSDPVKKARLIDMAASWSLLAHKRQEPTLQQQQQVHLKEGKKQKPKAQRTS
jgi:hypothetical protein